MSAPSDERRRGLRGALTADQYRLLERSVLTHAPDLIPLLTQTAGALSREDLAGLRRAVADEFNANGLADQAGNRRTSEFESLVDALAPERWERSG